MSQSERNSFVTAAVAILLVLAVPSLVFLITGLVEGMSVADVTTALIAQLGSEARPNLLVTGAIGLLPLAVLGLVMWIHRKRKGSPIGRKHLCWGGLVALVAVLIWSNHEFWSVFLPGLRAPGFPHGLELFIGPVFFAPVAMAVAMLAAWAAGRSRR